MENIVAFSGRELLSASVAAVGGGDLVFGNIPVSGNQFRMRVSFSVPLQNAGGVVQSITAVGAEATNLENAQESACAAAIQVLLADYSYTCLDYSLFRVWECQKRFIGLSEKLEQSKVLFDDVLRRSLVAFESVMACSMFCGSKISELGGYESMCSSVRSCASHLEAMYVQAMNEHNDRVERFEELNMVGDFGALLASAGFNVPDNKDVSTRLEGGLNLILNRVSEALMYHPPEIEVKTRGSEYRCFLHFVSVDGDESRYFRPFGEISENVTIARHSAIYRSLVACSVNEKVTIVDPNRGAYIFSRARVDEISSDIVLLGELGSAACRRIQTMITSLDVIVSTYSSSLSGHSVGDMPIGKLCSLYSSLSQRLERISVKVRKLNENLIIAKLEF